MGIGGRRDFLRSVDVGTMALSASPLFGKGRSQEKRTPPRPNIIRV